MAAKELGEALDLLFATTPEKFLETRDALVKELKAAGNKPASAEVKAAHKPTAAAFALNRLAREAAAELVGLFEAGRALASGQDFQAALERQRVALDGVSKKVTGPDVPAIIAVVRGAQVDPALAEQVKLGRFSKLPEVTAFFGLSPTAPAAHAPIALERVPEAANEKEPVDEAALARALELARVEAVKKAEESERHERELREAEQEATTLAAEAAAAWEKATEARVRSQAATERVTRLRGRR